MVNLHNSESEHSAGLVQNPRAANKQVQSSLLEITSKFNIPLNERFDSYTTKALEIFERLSSHIKNNFSENEILAPAIAEISELADLNSSSKTGIFSVETYEKQIAELSKQVLGCSVDILSDPAESEHLKAMLRSIDHEHRSRNLELLKICLDVVHKEYEKNYLCDFNELQNRGRYDLDSTTSVTLNAIKGHIKVSLLNEVIKHDEFEKLHLLLSNLQDMKDLINTINPKTKNQTLFSQFNEQEDLARVKQSAKIMEISLRFEELHAVSSS